MGRMDSSHLRGLYALVFESDGLDARAVRCMYVRRRVMYTVTEVASMDGWNWRSECRKY